MNNRNRFRMRRGFIFLPIFIIAILLFALVVMLLWNAILPAVIHVTAITFPQALGILILSKILFGGFHRRRWGSDRRHAWQQKFANMTPEDREKFKAEWRNRCNRWSGKEQSTASSSTTTQP